MVEVRLGKLIGRYRLVVLRNIHLCGTVQKKQVAIHSTFTGVNYYFIYSF